MTRHRIHRLATALALVLALPVQAEEPTAPAQAAADAATFSGPEEKRVSNPFTPGEELVYKVTALGMHAGKARISVGLGAPRDGVEAWPVVVQARTDSIFDSIYTVRDKFVTWWHPETNRVIGADFFADEGGRRQRSTSRLDHERGKAEVQRYREWNGSRSKGTYDIPPGAFDIAGAIFELRRRGLEPGSVEEIDVFTGKNVFRMRAVVERRETLRTAAGTFPAVQVRISLGFDGQFASKRDVKAWFSDDERHVPLRFEAEFVLGSIVAELLEERRGIRI